MANLAQILPAFEVETTSAAFPLLRFEAWNEQDAQRRAERVMAAAAEDCADEERDYRETHQRYFKDFPTARVVAVRAYPHHGVPLKLRLMRRLWKCELSGHRWDWLPWKPLSPTIRCVFCLQGMHGGDGYSPDPPESERDRWLTTGEPSFPR